MPARPRKRVRRRRQVKDLSDSSTSSSSSSGSDSNSEDEQHTTKDLTKPTIIHSSSSSSSNSSEDDEFTSKHSRNSNLISTQTSTKSLSSSDTDESESESETKTIAKRGRLAKKEKQKLNPIITEPKPFTKRIPSPIPSSPNPPITFETHELESSIPSFKHPPQFDFKNPKPNQKRDDLNQQINQSETDFKSWYISKLVHQFEHELDLIRTDLDSSTSKKNFSFMNVDNRFQLLISTLNSGVDLFHESNLHSAFIENHQTEIDLVLETLNIQKDLEIQLQKNLNSKYQNENVE